MSWFYVADGKQAGPVEESTLAELSAAGSILSTTLVWREGMAEWTPLAKAVPQVIPATAMAPAPSLEFAPKPPPAPNAASADSGDGSPPVMCEECRGLFRMDDTVTLQGARICGACKPNAVAKIREGRSVGGVQLPGMLARRLNALIVDGLIIGLAGNGLQSVVMVGVNAATKSEAWAIGISVLFGFLVNAAYFIFFWAKFGATPGKMLYKLKVIGADNQPLTWKKSTFRWLGTMVSGLTLYIGYMMAFLDERRRALHDRMAGTLVVENN